MVCSSLRLALALSEYKFKSPPFIHSPSERYLRGFQVLPATNRAAMEWRVAGRKRFLYKLKPEIPILLTKEL